MNMIEKKPAERIFELELTETEAEWLYGIMTNIGGLPLAYEICADAVLLSISDCRSDAFAFEAGRHKAVSGSMFVEENSDEAFDEDEDGL